MIYTPPITRRSNGRAHWYVDAAGQRVPGVTTLLKEGVPAPGLTRWAANSVADYALDHWDDLAEQLPSVRSKTLRGAPWADRDAAAGRGTDVHRLAEQLVQGLEVDVPDELAGHVESYVRFLDEWDPAPLLTEAAVINYRWGYAGTCDLVATIADERWLLDVKTTRRRVYAEAALQLAAYRNAERYVHAPGDERPMLDVDRTGVVWVRADGYDLIPVQTGDDVFRVFLYAAHVARWRTDAADQVVGEALRLEEAA